jgi:hypothetical protein
MLAGWMPTPRACSPHRDAEWMPLMCASYHPACPGPWRDSAGTLSCAQVQHGRTAAAEAASEAASTPELEAPGVKADPPKAAAAGSRDGTAAAAAAAAAVPQLASRDLAPGGAINARRSLYRPRCNTRAVSIKVRRCRQIQTFTATPCRPIWCSNNCACSVRHCLAARAVRTTCSGSTCPFGSCSADSACMLLLRPCTI